MSADLTYCLNIHPTQTLAEVVDALTGPVAAVKARLSPDTAFPIGLRLSAQALQDLAAPPARAMFKAALAEGDLRPVTTNGFPYGRFHGTRVKEEVYLPDWRAPERLAYTNALADLMAEINPAGAFRSLSTVPGAFRPNGRGAEAVMAEGYLQAVAHCVRREAETGRRVALAIEPEPCCFLETIAETVAFFEAHLFGPSAVRRLGELTGLGSGAAAAALPRHLGLCYDVCHAAVEFEDPAASLAALAGAGIPVHKLQLSSALRIPEGGPAARAALSQYAEPTYLHQLIARGPGGLSRFADLPEALATGGARDGEEWRVHFHVPVFLAELPEFGTTQAFLEEILALHRADPIAPHLEVETYSWAVLPPGLGAGSVEEAVARELLWVRERLG